MYNSCIEPVKPSMIYDSNAKSNAALAYSYLKRIYSYWMRYFQANGNALLLEK